MNGLTLRIVGDKKFKPVKKDVEKDDLQICLKEFLDSNLDLIQQLFRAETVEEQINIIKEMFNTMKDKANNDFQLYVDVVVNVFLCITGSSPLKSQLSRLMTTAPADLLTRIQGSLLDKLNGRLSQLSLSIQEVSEHSAALSSCLEVSNNSHFSSKGTETLVLDFIEHSMRVCLNNFQEEFGPAKKLSVITSLHGCVRCAITFFQKYSPRISDTMLNLTIELMGNPDLPLDTRANLGILSVLIVQQNYCQWQQLLVRVYETYGDEMSTLSLCSGLLNVLTSEDLQTSITFQNQEKEAIFIINDIIISIEESNPSESGIVLGASRCLLLVTKSLLQCPHLLHRNFVLGLLPWIWSHSEHYMDAVRHLATAILSNIVSVGALQTDVEIFDMILDAVCSMEVDRRCRHFALTVLIGRVPVSSLLDRCPNLVTGLCQTALKGPGVNSALCAVEGLMCQDYKERPTPAWTQLWLLPFLRQTRPSPPLEHALTAAIRLHPPLLHHIVDAELNINSDNIGVILMCLKIGRKWNLLKGNDSSDKWKGLLDFTILQECMYHYDDEVRLSSLALITESPKTTEAFSEEELQLVKQFLQYNMANQSPAVRQKSIAYFKKFLCRLRESMGPLERKMLKTKDTNVERLLGKYSEFCHWLWKTCLDSLFPGASPSRRSAALAILSLVKEIGLEVPYHEQDAQVLLSCLLDSYEENKAIARDLLIAMPPELLKFNNRAHIESYLKKTIFLGSSIRPPDSISAAYYMSVLGACQIATSNWSGTFEKMLKNTEYLVLQEVFSKLEEELRIAKLSLLIAASSGPLYGQLFVIRHILQRIDLREVSLEERWRDLIRRVIETAFCCNDVVACIVNDSSPEGHLPMDLTYSSMRKDTDPQVTCQMVLLCSWRTVKEVSLLLGELAERAPISHLAVVGLVTEEQVLAVGDHLTGLLSSTKHRGAFEQAYLGFSKLAGRLWKCTEGKLHELPNKWLNETLGWISCNEKLSATRRSAGIPFIIQGLVCSEMESGSCKSLHHAMNSLLEMAKEESEEGRVHSLNILRALFRGSALGEAVGPYVAEGIAIAISGFNSSTWAERNSSTLLLSALISRVFGVPREKSETLSWRNKMTGRLFFHRYPSLYGELLSHLQAASQIHIYPALYPVLLVLGRLYPSSLEGTDSNLELMKYVPYVKKVTESSILKTRSLAASALTALIPPSLYVEHIDQLFEEVRKQSAQNQLHGLLLAILKLVQRAVEIDEIDRVKINAHIAKWLDDIFAILSSKNHSFITRNACVEIVIYLFSEFHEEIPFQYIEKIGNILEENCFETSDVESHTKYGYSVFLAHASILILILKLYDNNEDLLLDKIIQLISHSSYDIFSVVLDFLDFILKNDTAIFNPDSYDNFKIKLKIEKIDENVLKKIRFSQDLTNVLVDSLYQKKHHDDITRLLKTIRYFPLIFQDLQRKENCVITFFVNFCQYEKDVLAPYSILCIDEFLSVFFQRPNACLHLEELTIVTNIVHYYSNPKWDDDCRESVAVLMANHFLKLISGASPLCCLMLWSCALRLIQDENSEIRDKLCTSVLDFVTPSRGIELLLKNFVQLTSEPALVATGLLYWATGGLGQSESSEELKDCVFEKGDENVYSEELIVNRICCIHLKHIYDSESDFLSLKIEEDVNKWILAESNITTGSTIVSFIDNYKTSVIDLCRQYQPNSLLPLTPFENKIILLKIKLKNIINALPL